MTANIRHINTNIHHLRKSIELGEIETILIGADNMSVDIFTDHFTLKLHEYLRRLTSGYRTSTDLERRNAKPEIPKGLQKLMAKEF